MTISLRSINQDEVNPLRWYFQVYGPDSVDGTVRIGRVDETGLEPEDWLAANLVTAQALIDAGEVHDGLNADEARDVLGTWFINNPVAAGMFKQSPDDVRDEINDFLDDLFPSATAAEKGKLRRVLVPLVLAVKMEARRQGII